MPHLLIRILVAVATFAVGLAASALWGFFTPSPTPSAPATARSEVTVRIDPPVVVATRPDVTVAIRTASVVIGGKLNEKAFDTPAPAYPAAARQARASGTVVVDIVVGENGEVTTARATSGHPLLRQAAEAAVRRWKFLPTRLAGEPIKVSGWVMVNFTAE